MSPDQGHESSRFALGARGDDDDSAAVLRVRAAYHDRLDPTAGFPAGGEIEFAELALLAGEDDVQVSELKIVGIQSVTPWDRAFRPWLWQAQTGVRRYGLDALGARHRGALGGYLDFGFGFAAGDDTRAVAYGFGLVAFDANRDVERGHALAGGLRAGLWLPWSDTFIQQLEADVLGPLAGGARHIAKGSFATQWQFTHDDGLRLLLNYGDQDDTHARSVELRWHRYF